jgi:hypothetical protein
MPLERDAAARFGLDDVSIFGCDGVDAEVPDAKIDGLVGDDFHEGELAEVERLRGSDFEPVTAGKELGRGFDDVFLVLTAAEERDANAGDDASSGADVGADDDVAAVGRAAAGVVRNVAGCAVSVDGKRRASGVADSLVADAEVEDGIFDVELDRRGLAFKLDDLVGGREGVDGGLQEIVRGVAVEIAVGLGEGN